MLTQLVGVAVEQTVTVVKTPSGYPSLRPLSDVTVTQLVAELPQLVLRAEEEPPPLPPLPPLPPVPPVLLALLEPEPPPQAVAKINSDVTTAKTAPEAR
jgi:hypothetical protein